MGLISKNIIKSFIPGGVLPIPMEYKNICDFGNIVVCGKYIYLTMGNNYPSFVGDSIKRQGYSILLMLDKNKIKGWSYDIVNLWKDKFPKVNMDFEDTNWFNILSIYKTDISFDDVNEFEDFRKTYLNLGLDKKPEEIIREYGTYN